MLEKLDSRIVPVVNSKYSFGATDLANSNRETESGQNSNQLEKHLLLKVVQMMEELSNLTRQSFTSMISISESQRTTVFSVHTNLQALSVVMTVQVLNGLQIKVQQTIHRVS